MSQEQLENNSLNKVDSLVATRLTRRGLLKKAMTYGAGLTALGAMSSILEACGTSSSSKIASSSSKNKVLTPVSLQLNWLENVEFAGVLWALNKGYYRDEVLI